MIKPHNFYNKIIIVNLRVPLLLGQIQDNTSHIVLMLVPVKCYDKQLFALILCTADIL